MEEYIAHVKEDDNQNWCVHSLDEHLQEVSRIASVMADSFQSNKWAELAGLWHDLGKFRKKFQDYIRIQTGFDKENAHIENGNRAPHSTAGAIHSVQQIGNVYGHILAYIIAGHHAGLPDWEGGQGSLQYRLSQSLDEYEQALSCDILPGILKGDKPEIPKQVVQSPELISLWIRMLFSCVVDADFLDTEKFMNPEKSELRQNPITIHALKSSFEGSMQELQKNAKNSPLTKIRNEILDQCNNAAELKPGIFSLTVPTGGGKTLSSLSFALKHASLYQKKRVIYAIPFTSIIEQNASVFREFLGDDSVLEHHCNLDVDPSKENSRARIATENWDAPLIVTTNVQLFESLHSSRTSRCRKLHNIIDSVIILDEAQQLPRDFHAPITQVMQQLSDHYGVTWVLCTATQPELSKSQNTFGQTLLEGLSDIREIMPNLAELAEKLKRVEVQMPSQDEPKKSWSEMAQIIGEEDCVLAIVNTRKNARELYELLPDDGNNLHLSAHMCAQHRTQVIDEIRQRLKDRINGCNRPLRVISTQLIEAGVDVDFPVVFRAMAGLDSIAQSAGRCNREGKLDGLGKVVVFKPEAKTPPGFLSQGENATLEMISANNMHDPLMPENFRKYFTLVNSKGSRDKHGIVDLLRVKQSNDNPLSIQFRTAAEKFRLIDNSGVAIIVPFVPENMELSPVDGWIKRLEYDPSIKSVYRKLQRYTVTVPENFADKLKEMGCIEERTGLLVLIESFYHKYLGVNSLDELIAAEQCVF